MLSVVHSSALYGIEAYPLTVEVDSSRGLPAFNIVGLPDTAVKESRERVEAAIKNSGYRFPSSRITVNLAPADVKKEGSSLDLPIALAILSAANVLSPKTVNDYLMVGELSLDGTLRTVKGALSTAIMAAERNYRGVILPPGNAAEAAVVKNIEVIPVESISHAVAFLDDEIEIDPYNLDISVVYGQSSGGGIDFSDVKGHAHAKRALEVAAAGAHNVLMIGPPGSGKTMLAKRFGSILPDLTLEESIEITRIHSISGILEEGAALVTERPFRNPHHTVSNAGMAGGGTVPAPGEVSLAHNGVLFLDELPEFPRNVLEVLRQPMEDREVTISRASRTVTFPASFSLIGSMNPCPCGYYGSSLKECVCTPGIINRYRSKISGPLLDRIDIHIEVPALKFREMDGGSRGEKSAVLRERVNGARKMQSQRYSGSPVFCNALMNQKQIRKHCIVDNRSGRLLEHAVDKLGLSARAYDRILKVSRTIADLEGAPDINVNHISEAIQYRSLDRTGRY